jgi:phosphatidylserine/phosphatidylglycerophosphate/cardiolipin synthase-like enzyme
MASQEYVRRFAGKKPSQLSGAEKAGAYRWLSRGLLEAFETFVARADTADFGLYGAFYEFQWPEALAALKRAADAGATVRILYDGIAAIHKAGIEGLCEPRTTGKLMHNKFVVLMQHDAPIAVWTGSTNLTENGIFGHSNCAHVIEDPAIAAAYLQFWQELRTNPERTTEQTWMAASNPRPPDPWDADVTAVFSPRNGLAVLDWYAEIAASAKQALFMSFAFGMHRKFQAVYEQPDDVLRFALMDKEGSGTGLAQGRIDIGRIRRRRNVVVAVGNRIVTNAYDRWLVETGGLSSNVQWVHTKYMLVDPLGDDPVIVTGSANFSEPSTNVNNENMLVIRGDTRAADIYLGEFMRLYSHYAFREAVKIARERGDTDWQPNHLAPDSSWLSSYFQTGQRSLRRRYFAGT